ncbi:aminopeptidase NAALADL1-like [Branchiostoma floridae x Branchiostoma belcheri]
MEPGYGAILLGSDRVENFEEGKRPMSKGRSILLAVLCGCVALGVGVIIGWFSKTGLTEEDRVALDKFRALVRGADGTVRNTIMDEIDSERIRENLRELARRPHMAGTAPDLEMAELLRQTWLDNGLDEARLVPYDFLLSYPPMGEMGQNNTVVTVDGVGYEFNDTRTAHIEPELQGDPDAPQFFYAFSPPGNPVGELVFANYGRPQDFEYLEKNASINCTGKIAIVKYGRELRGAKATNAAAVGMVGVIIYPDPADVNVPGLPVYPDSWFLPGTGVERGSALADPGEPLTPGYPATDYAYRRPLGDVDVFPPIPILPISYNDAQEYVRRLSGEEVPSGWNGSLPITYRLGPGFTDDWAAREVRMNVYTNTSIQRVYNVIGMIKGRVEPDRYVMFGNHYDSWVQGAIDDTSSTAISLELTRVFGNLATEGKWRPRRSVVFAAWGAEEFGLFGSMEYVEQYAKLLGERLVTYVNMDVGVSGNYSLAVGASPSLRNAIYEATKRVPSPHNTPDKTVYDDWAQGEETPFIGGITLSTDHSSFALRVGTPVMTMAYDHDKTGYPIGTAYPVYHTGYDNMDVMERFVDPDFSVHRALARTAGELLRHLSDEVLLPLEWEQYVPVLTAGLNATETDYGTALEEQGIRLDGLSSAIQNFSAAAAAFQDILDRVDKDNPIQARMVNDQLVAVNKAFIDTNSQHVFFKHVLFSPPYCTVGTSNAFPGIVDAMCGGPQGEGWEEVKKQVAAITFTIQSAADALNDVDSIAGPKW